MLLKVANATLKGPHSGGKGEGDCTHRASFAKASAPMVDAMERVKGKGHLVFAEFRVFTLGFALTGWLQNG